MSEFNGILESVFDCCVPSEDIRIPINILKALQEFIEPELRVINPYLIGHVSRIKKRGTNDYNDWAWLYFNAQPHDACKFTQLTVNISPARLYVGLHIRTSKEFQNLQKNILKPVNSLKLENSLAALSLRDLFFATDDDDWETSVQRQYSVEELKGKIQMPQLFWINVAFEKNDSALRRKSIAKTIVQIFTELYNIFALATDNETMQQVVSNRKSFVPDIVVDKVDSSIESQKTDEDIVRDFLQSLKIVSDSINHHLPGKNDQYYVKRTALEYDLKPYKLELRGLPTVIYSEQDISASKNQISEDYDACVQQLDKISNMLNLPKGFLRIMFVNPLTDARYSRVSGGNVIFINVAAFHSQRNLFFWLFTVTRELAYIKNHRIGYPFFKDMRRLMVYALTNVQNT